MRKVAVSEVRKDDDGVAHHVWRVLQDDDDGPLVGWRPWCRYTELRGGMFVLDLLPHDAPAADTATCLSCIVSEL